MRTACINGSRLSWRPGCTFNKHRFKIKIGELTLAEATQTSSPIEQDLFFFWGTPHISNFTWISIHHFPLCKCKQKSFSRHCNARLSAVKVWDIIENRACAAVVHGFSKLRTTFECIYTNTFTSKVSRGLDKPIPKPLCQDKPRLELPNGLNKPWT